MGSLGGVSGSPSALLRAHPVFDAARCRSLDLLGRIRGTLSQVDPSFRAVAFSGSLGRLEFGEGSDGDAIVFVADEASESQRVETISQVTARLRQLGLPPPNPQGIFAEPISAAVLLDPKRRGLLSEEPAVFGKRIQILLDTRAAVGETWLAELRRDILHWYGVDDAEDRWGYLLDDLLRYHRALGVLARWQYRSDPGEWRIQNLKYAHSRRVMVAGLVVLLGESTLAADPVRSMVDGLDQTPLERLAAAYEAANDPGFATLLSLYAEFVVAMNDPATRRRISDSTLKDEQPEIDRRLRQNGKELLRELDRFVRSRAGDWSECLRGRLLF